MFEENGHSDAETTHTHERSLDASEQGAQAEVFKVGRLTRIGLAAVLTLLMLPTVLRGDTRRR